MKTLYCVVGLPGSGKTTVATFLSRVLGCTRFHLPSVVGHLLSEKTRAMYRRYGRLFPHTFDREFLRRISKERSSVVVLDGYPPSPWHLRFLQRYAKHYGWDVQVLHMRFPVAHELLLSASRQLRRDIRQGKHGITRIFWKIFRASLHSPAVVRDALRGGIPVHVVHAHESLGVVEEQVRSHLGLDLQRIPWDREMLQILAAVAPDAWVTGGGHVYKPFFNGVFGPMIESWDVDIRVAGLERAQAVQRKLESRAPLIRWHVKDALSWAKQEMGRNLSCVEEAIGCMCLICVCVGVRWRDGHVEVHWGHPEAEADLRNGVLRPNHHGQMNFAQDKATKIALYYPGVSAPFINHERVEILETFPEAVRQLHEIERGGHRQWNGLNGTERARAGRVTCMREGLAQVAHVVPWPDPAPIPAGDPWRAPDANFRAWVANQTRSRKPVGGRDPYLAAALACQKGIVQKPTHQGWSLHLHALHALLQVETDHLPTFRRPLRLAALWHDVGKIWGIRTPGAHPLIGAKRWQSMECQVFPDMTLQEAKLISFLIANHDIFGRLERGLWDEKYQGAMDPTAVRKTLTHDGLLLTVTTQLTKALWRADVGSVSLLRWLLPLSDPLEQLISGGSGT